MESERELCALGELDSYELLDALSDIADADLGLADTFECELLREPRDAVASLAGQLIDDAHFSECLDGGTDGWVAQRHMWPDLRHATQHQSCQLFEDQANIACPRPESGDAGTIGGK